MYLNLICTIPPMTKPATLFVHLELSSNGVLLKRKWSIHPRNGIMWFWNTFEAHFHNAMIVSYNINLFSFVLLCCLRYRCRICDIQSKTQQSFGKSCSIDKRQWHNTTSIALKTIIRGNPISMFKITNPIYEPPFLKLSICNRKALFIATKALLSSDNWSQYAFI